MVPTPLCRKKHVRLWRSSCFNNNKKLSCSQERADCTTLSGITSQHAILDVDMFCGSLVHSMFLTYLPDGTNISGLRGGEFEGMRSVFGLMVIRFCSLGHFLFTCSDTCCRMYCLVTIRRVTDRWMDGRQYDAISPSHCV